MANQSGFKTKKREGNATASSEFKTSINLPSQRVTNEISLSRIDQTVRKGEKMRDRLDMSFVLHLLFHHRKEQHQLAFIRILTL